MKTSLGTLVSAAYFHLIRINYVSSRASRLFPSALFLDAMNNAVSGWCYGVTEGSPARRFAGMMILSFSQIVIYLDEADRH